MFTSILMMKAINGNGVVLNVYVSGIRLSNSLTGFCFLVLFVYLIALLTETLAV